MGLHDGRLAQLLCLPTFPFITFLRQIVLGKDSCLSWSAADLGAVWTLKLLEGRAVFFTR